MEYAMAYTIEHHAHQPGQLRKLLLLGGNMNMFYEDDIAGFGTFITKYPQAVEALPGWAAEVDTEVQTFPDRCNKLLTTYPMQTTTQEVAQILGDPKTVQEAVSAMEQQIARGDWCMGDITPEAKALVAALATTVQHRKSLGDLEESGLNLYQTLTPQHLGKAMATGLVSWEMMAKWTTAQADASQVIPRCAPSGTPGVPQENRSNPRYSTPRCRYRGRKGYS